MFKQIDKISLVFVGINLIYILFGWTRISKPEIHFPAYSAIGIGIFILVKTKEKSKFLTFLHNFYPVFLFGYFFESTSAFNQVIFTDYIDPFFQKIDAAIFGYQPALVWGKKYNNYFINELFCFAYFSYYLMIIGIPIWLYIKKRQYIYKFVFIISFVFYICYLTYNVLPVIGGRYFAEAKQITELYRYGLFTRIMAFIYNSSHHLGGAFPSSHVAIALVISILTFKITQKLGYILFIITFFLTISTIYCHYHYFIDTVFGLIYGVAFYYLGSWLYRKL